MAWVHGMTHRFLKNSYSAFVTVTPSKIKLRTSQYRKSRIWEMKEYKYTKSLVKNQVCAIIHMRDIFTQIYKALYGDAMLLSL